LQQRACLASAKQLSIENSSNTTSSTPSRKNQGPVSNNPLVRIFRSCLAQFLQFALNLAFRSWQLFFVPKPRSLNLVNFSRLKCSRFRRFFSGPLWEESQQTVSTWNPARYFLSCGLPYD
jgi:hypothetical protein